MTIIFSKEINTFLTMEGLNYAVIENYIISFYNIENNIDSQTKLTSKYVL